MAAATTTSSASRMLEESTRPSRNHSSRKAPSASLSSIITTSSTSTKTPSHGRSRTVSKTNSNESLDAMKVFLEDRATAEKPRSRSGLDSSLSLTKTPNSNMSNRRRVALAAADKFKLANQESLSGSLSLNDSAGSLVSSSSKEERRPASRRFRAGEKISRQRPTVSSHEEDEEEEEEDEETETIVSHTSSRYRQSSTTGRSHRSGHTGGRSTTRDKDAKDAEEGRSGSRSKSRSHSQSRKRSKSAKARNRRTAPSRTASGDGSLNQMRGSSQQQQQQQQQHHHHQHQPRRTRGSSKDRSDLDESQDDLRNSSTDIVASLSPLSRGTGTGTGRGSRSGGRSGNRELYSPKCEQEILDFLVTPEGEDTTPTNSQRLTRSMDNLDFKLDNEEKNNNDNSGRANRSIGGSRSMRRERTVGTGSTSRTRTASSRDSTSTSYQRPPRSSRGIGRSKSDMEGLLSPIPSPRKPSEIIHIENPILRSPPGRSKSAPDGAGDLGDFFSRNNTAHVSRRKKPASGNRSVASMPTRARRIRLVKPDVDDTKQPSSRTTVTAGESFDSDNDEDEEYESMNESTAEESNYNRVTPSSRSVSDYGDQSVIGAADIEAALQLHMSRTENLLFDVFPKHVAEALRSGRKVEPENHECVTIFFSDIVGFTNISSELDPMKVSDLLDRLYNSFDALSHYHDVFKVETIGDAYMAVTNLTKSQKDHCKRIAEFAIDAIRVANQTLIDKDDPKRGFVNIRVGFHSGPVVSNVVGSRNPRFCLFGDTVNTANRMESNSEVNRIHCSHTSAELLREQHPALKLNPRGTIEVKGKGEMETFWVNEDAALVSQRDGTSRSIFKILKAANPKNRRGSVY